MSLRSDAPAEVLEAVDRANRDWLDADAHLYVAMRARAEAVRAALDAGCSTRQVGARLGLSHVRVQQIARTVGLPSDAPAGDAA